MSHPLNERRRRERITLRCPVEIVISGEVAPRRATTQNMSSSGVYCLSSTPFSPGERLPCHIEITPKSYSLGTEAVYLDCVLEVVRVQRTEDAYGIGCRIVRYVLRRSSHAPSELGEAGFSSRAAGI
jgi:hypothetical protein